MSYILKSGYCSFANKECTIGISLIDNSDLENPRQKIEISRISCEYASLVKCNPTKCPILKEHNLSF